MSTPNYFGFLSHYTVKFVICSHFYAESSITQKSKQRSLGVLLHKNIFYRAITLQRKGIRVENIWDLSGITLYLKLKINFYHGICTFAPLI